MYLPMKADFISPIPENNAIIIEGESLANPENLDNLMAHLKQNKKLTQILIYICGNVNAKLLNYLCSSIKDLSITELQIKITSTQPQDLSQLFELIKSRHWLKIHIFANLTSTALSKLLEELSDHPDLTDLTIAETTFSAPYLEKFINILSILTNLKSLSILQAQINNQQAKKIIEQAASLCALNLSWNNIFYSPDSNDFIEFCNALARSKLSLFDLSNTKLGDIEVEHLARTFVFLDRRFHFVMAACSSHLTEIGIGYFKQALQINERFTVTLEDSLNLLTPSAMANLEALQERNQENILPTLVRLAARTVAEYELPCTNLPVECTKIVPSKFLLTTLWHNAKSISPETTCNTAMDRVLNSLKI